MDNQNMYVEKINRILFSVDFNRLDARSVRKTLRESSNNLKME